MRTCILTLIKDERDYLDDFLKYHTEMGLEIFIFQDLFSVDHSDICSKYENVYFHSLKELYSPNEIPKLIENRKNRVPPQTDFINRGLKYIKNLGIYDWCWLIDIDEYITCSEPYEDILNRYKERDAILVYWKNYGCSGHIYKPVYDRPIYEIYTQQCGYELYSDYKYFKITKFCVNMNNYKPTMKFWIHHTLINWIKADGTFKRTEIVYEPLYLRHYITKSWEEWCWKIKIRGLFHENHRQYKSFYEMEPEMVEKIKKEKDFKDYFYKKYGIMLDY